MGLVRAAESRGVTVRVQRVGSMLTVFFRGEPVRSWSDAAASDTKRFAAWHAALLEGGVYWPPSQFEAAFVSAAHDPGDISKTIDVASAAFAKARSI
jgi:glutamate-1-semialdehyde 2,1-aminomutase